MPGLLAHTAAQFDHCKRRRKQARDVAGVAPQQTLIRACESVFWKMRDGLKQRASQFVVEILGMQLLLGLREARTHVGREFAYGGVLLAFNLRPAENLRRHRDSWVGTSYGKNGAACRQPSPATRPS